MDQIIELDVLLNVSFNENLRYLYLITRRYPMHVVVGIAKNVK